MSLALGVMVHRMVFCFICKTWFKKQIERKRIINPFFHPFLSLLFRLIEPLNLDKAVDLYQKAAGVFEVGSHPNLKIHLY